MLKGRYLYFITSLLIAVFSSFSVWIIDSWIKFPLAVIEIVTILYISLVVTEWDFRFPSVQNRIRIPFIPIIPELILLAFSCLLALLNLYDQSGHGTIFQLGMSVASSTILVGLCIFNIFNHCQSFTNLERLLISFSIGVVFSSILSLLVLQLDLSSKPIAISTIFGGIAITSLIIRTTREEVGQKETNNSRSFLRNVDMLGLIICEAFFIILVLCIYPEAAYIIGTDINRHYGNTLVLLTSPSLFNSFQYVFFNLFQGAIISLSGMNQDIGLLQTSLIMLNGLIPLSVYAMARRYLSKFDVRIPILATILYLLFSNLSFVYYIEQKITGNHGTEWAAIIADWRKNFLGTHEFHSTHSFSYPAVDLCYFFYNFSIDAYCNFPEQN